MNRAAEKLSSMYLTLWSLAFLIVWVGVGLYMAGSDAYIKDFRMMNNMHIREWLFSGRADTGFLKVWFVILCAAMTVMGINLIFCSWSKIFRIMRAKFSGRQFYMLIVHALFGFVALGHLGGLLMGFEYNNIKLGTGLIHTSEEGYEIKVKEVHFVGDVKALSKSKRDITRDELDYKKSYAEVSLSKDDELLKTGKISLLNPLRYNDIQVTLRSFILPENIKGDPGPDTSAWTMLTFSRNPALSMFLLVYPVMIAGIFIYLIITWRKPGFNKNNG
jgi:hypothetical protein